MKSPAPLFSEDSARYATWMAQVVAITRHADLLEWLRGDVQHCLPHDILMVGWGDFQDGAIQHDILSELPGARSYGPGTEGVPFLLGRLHDYWVAGGVVPCCLDFKQFTHLMGNASLPGSFPRALSGMRSVLVHAMHDERARQTCLYAFLSTDVIPAEPAQQAAKVLMPSIDHALRQIALLPQQHPQPPVAARSVPDDACGLSERETQIMAWVAMGKTNAEIGTILNISGYTVKNHMQRIFQKLNVFNRAQAVSRITRVSLHG
ncbi:MAG: XrtB/PEP-CTERM-associated transcriptional regulator EpsA [Polaromonas sp.]